LAYLFWAFAAVWVAISLYLYALIRKNEALEREVAALRERPPRPKP